MPDKRTHTIHCRSGSVYVVCHVTNAHTKGDSSGIRFSVYRPPSKSHDAPDDTTQADLTVEDHEQRHARDGILEELLDQDALVSFDSAGQNVWVFNESQPSEQLFIRRGYVRT